MLVELVDEVTLNRFEGLVHPVQHQVVPIGAQAHELAEAARAILYKREGDYSVKQIVIAAKFYFSLWYP